MNIIEKKILILLGIIIFIITAFSLQELRESPYREVTEGEISDFDKSFGDTFIMMDFNTLTQASSSDTQEKDCDMQKPVIVSTLHTLQEQIEDEFGGFLKNSGDSFQVNQSVLNMFCSKTTTITLQNNEGASLTLSKKPFVRKIPAGGDESDIGTLVTIDATITSPAISTPATTSVQMLIPDKLLTE